MARPQNPKLKTTLVQLRKTTLKKLADYTHKTETYDQAIMRLLRVKE